MSKHTPGPWEAGDVDGDDIYIWSEGQKQFVGLASYEDGTQREVQANAHLIAAAPELLEACELAEQFWYADHPNDTVEAQQARRQLRAAIAKATGSSARTGPTECKPDICEGAK